jgi:alginate O-acetyltransferase complex protein AlgJ
LTGLAALAGAALFRPAAAFTLIKAAVVGKDGWLFLMWDDPRHADARRMQRATQILNTAVQSLKAAGIDTVMLVTPAKARIYSDMLPDDFSFTPEGQRRYAAGLAAIGSAPALAPDLSDSFAALRQNDPATPVFFKADTHWTGLTARATATLVAQQIKDKLKLPPSNKPGTRLGALVTQTQPHNDLLEMLPAAEQAAYPPQTFQTREIVAAKTTAAMLEDDTADVVVVGNSYMQPKYNFAAELSNALDRPVALNWRYHTVGPYRTLLNYLASPGFRKQRPRVIVWNFHELDLMVMPDDDASWGEDAMDAATFLDAVKKAVA